MFITDYTNKVFKIIITSSIMISQNVEAMGKKLLDSVIYSDEHNWIDFKKTEKIPVVVCYVLWGEKLLILKRTKEVCSFQEKWNVVSGFIEKDKDIKTLILEELFEETGLLESNIDTVSKCMISELHDSSNDVTAVGFNFLIRVKEKFIVKLDFEHSAYVWVNKNELKEFDTVSRIVENFETLVNEY